MLILHSSTETRSAGTDTYERSGHVTRSHDLYPGGPTREDDPQRSHDPPPYG